MTSEKKHGQRWEEEIDEKKKGKKRKEYQRVWEVEKSHLPLVQRRSWGLGVPGGKR